MILPWLTVLVVLGAALLGVAITLKRKSQAHRQHHDVPMRDITPSSAGRDVHGTMPEQHGSYVGPS